MKKTCLISLLLVFSSLFSFAQEVTEKTSSNGIRSLSCQLKQLGYSILTDVSLECSIYPNGNCVYTLFLAINKQNIQISEGKKLLIKLDDGLILEFTSYLEKGRTESFSVYEIPDSAMKKIISKKITKIRIEYDSGYLDQETTDNQLSITLKQLYDEIQNVLTPIDIYSDF